MGDLGKYSRSARGSHAPRDSRASAPETYTKLGEAAGSSDRLMGAGPAAMINRAVQRVTRTPAEVKALEERARKARKP